MSELSNRKKNQVKKAIRIQQGISEKDLRTLEMEVEKEDKKICKMCDAEVDKKGAQYCDLCNHKKYTWFSEGKGSKLVELCTRKFSGMHPTTILERMTDQMIADIISK